MYYIYKQKKETMFKDLMRAVAVIILYAPTVASIYYKDEILYTFSGFEEHVKSAEFLNYPELTQASRFKEPNRQEKLLNQFSILKAFDKEVYKHLDSMTLYDKYIMSKEFEERKANPFIFRNTHDFVENQIKIDEPCKLENIKKRLECEESRNHQVDDTADKIHALFILSKYKHEIELETIEAILGEAIESTGNLLELKNILNVRDTTEISKQVTEWYYFFIIFVFSFSTYLQFCVTLCFRSPVIKGDE